VGGGNPRRAGLLEIEELSICLYITHSRIVSSGKLSAYLNCKHPAKPINVWTDTITAYRLHFSIEV
jgi:hypothetical protein